MKNLGPKLTSLKLSPLFFALIIFIYLTIIFSNFFLQFNYLSGYKLKENNIVSEDTSEVEVGNKKYNLYIAKTYQDMTKGLARFDSIKDNEGMLFIFDTPGNYTFFMKDMKFNIDIIFIDIDFKVIKIYQNVKKDSYKSPKDYEAYKTYEPAKYVIELNEGEVLKNDLKLGDFISLSNIQK